MITFSVVTITYNAEKVLQPTLDSVLMQNYSHIEHIIIDGASKDNTLQIALNHQKLSNKADNGHTIIIQSEPDKGLYDAMNKGLQKATGDYIIFLNAGDRFPKVETLKKVAIIAEPGDGEEMPAVLYGNTDIIDKDGIFLYHRQKEPPEDLTWKSFKEGMLVCHQAFYARTDIAKALPYNTKYHYSADIDWCINVMKEGERRGLLIKNVHTVVANYLKEGQTTLHHRASLIERYKIMCKHYGTFKTSLHHLRFLIHHFIK